MGRGQYKRKRESAQKRMEKDARKPLSVNQEVVAANKAVSSTKAKTTQGRKEQEETIPAKRIQPKEEQSWWKRPSITDYCLTAFTFVLAVTSIYQWNITNGQLQVMQNDERAWMTFEPTPPPKDAMGIVVEGKPIEFTLEFSNTGKTPGINVREQAILVLVDSGAHTPIELMDDPSRGWVLQSGILVPNKVVSQVITRTSGSGAYGQLATADEVKSVGSLKKHIVVFGRIDYMDIFHKKHWTKFCKYVTGLPTAECAQYNSTDEAN